MCVGGPNLTPLSIGTCLIYCIKVEKHRPLKLELVAGLGNARLVNSLGNISGLMPEPVSSTVTIAPSWYDTI
jgi:hypothetical protein